MIPVSNATSNSDISSQIDTVIKAIDLDIQDLVAKDADTASKKISDLLIEYILANMQGDTEGAKNIKDEMTSALKTFNNDVSQADQLKQQLKSILANPSDQTEDELAQLKSLLAELNKQVLSECS